MQVRSRVAIACLVVLVALIALSSPGLSWGDKGHHMITEAAIGVLPLGIKPFYEDNEKFIVALSTLPDDWKAYHKTEEGPNHYIDIDALDTPPFKRVQTTRAAAEKCFGKKALRGAGYLPWAIEARYAKLVCAFKGIDKVQGRERDRKLEDIVLQSAILAHYVADAHVPLHATKYHHGRSEAYKSVHADWESELLDRFGDKPRPDAPENVGKIPPAAFGWIIASWKQVDGILDANEKARKEHVGDSEGYYQGFYDSTAPALKGRLTSAAQALAGVYVAAWTEAGKPKLREGTAPLFWGR